MALNSFPLAAGGDDVWEVAALRCRPRLVSVARRVVRNRAEAEDVADEAIARLAREARCGAAIERVEGWLCRAVLRIAIDRARRWARLHLILPRLATRRGERASPPLREAERSELRERVWRAILSLPRRKQQVIVLHDMEGLPYAEVAALLGIREATARVHAHSAREALRRNLQGLLGG
ncbi:MAG: RNA polymerase sigma factor [Planctomycetota bacterium]